MVAYSYDRRVATKVRRVKVQELMGLFRRHGLELTRHGLMSLHHRGIERGGLEVKQSGPGALTVQWNYSGELRHGPETTKEMTDVLLAATKVMLEAGYIVKFPVTDKRLDAPGEVTDHDVSGGLLVVQAPAAE